MGTYALLYETDQEIVQEYCASGSNRAATAFVRKYQKFVYTTALRYIANTADADDIAQEVFIKALKSLSGFQGQSSLKTWLYRITVNISINYIRKRKVMSIFTSKDAEDYYDISDDNFSANKQIESKELFTQFYKAMNKLPNKQREVFALRYFDDLSYEEISSMLGTTVGGLKANYFQAIQKLAKELKGFKIGGDDAN